MSKKKPPIQRIAEKTQQEGESPVAPQVATDLHVSSIIEIPMATDYPPSEFGIHIDTRLTVPQATALRRVAHQLDRQQATLGNGRRVVSATDAMKWILEQIE